MMEEEPPTCPSQTRAREELNSSHRHPNNSNAKEVDPRPKPEQEHLPPLSVIVIQETPHSHASSNATPNGSGSSTGSRPFLSLHASSSPFSSGGTAFRLQPRNPVSTPSPVRSSGGSRGRKRCAQSMCTPMTADASTLSGPHDESETQGSRCREDSFSSSGRTSSLDTPPRAEKDGATTPPGGVHIDSTAMTFKGLTLQSPNQRLQPPVLEGYGSPHSLVGSQASLARSSFSKYCPNNSPVESIARGMSPPGSLMSSSPKFAPLTILAHAGARDAAATKTTPTRPPLPLGFASRMYGCSGSVGSNPGIFTPELHGYSKAPPLTVLCDDHQTAASDSSFSPQEGVISSAANVSSSTNASILAPSLPSMKHARTDYFGSPGSKRSTSSMSPTSTPLPKLNLTPRSASSHHSRSSRSRRENLPSFPSPMDVAGHGLSPAPNSSLCSDRSPRHPNSQRESFIPLPDWSHHSLPSSNGGNSKRPIQFQSTSLLAPPAADDPLEMYIVGASANDGDSLSASDDEEDFFLATPMAITEEKMSTLQQVKQRKLCSTDTLTESHFNSTSTGLFPLSSSKKNSSASFASSAKMSNASLLGMNFVTSNGNLPGMEKDSLKTTLSTKDFAFAEESQASIGLALEGKDSSSDDNASSSEPPVRDLVTPPVMSRPHSPPPLSPRINKKSPSNQVEDDSFFYYPSGQSEMWLTEGETDFIPSLHHTTARVMYASESERSPHATVPSS